MTTKQTPAKPQWVMAGTEGTGQYKVIAHNSAGRLGFRNLPDGTVRVRVEPSGPTEAAELAKLFEASTWRQPGEVGSKTYRFSRVVLEGDEAVATIKAALEQLKTRGRLRRNLRLIFWRRFV